MKTKRRDTVLRHIGAALSAALVIVCLSACESIYDDLEPCPHGVSLRFVYDYNMEFANSFHRNVDCLTLYIYDENGNYVDTKTVTGPELQDENYRMTLDLGEGDYHFVAYGGLACEKATFSPVQEPTSGSKNEDMRVRADIGRINSPVPAERQLHDMFWGELTLATADLYNEGTVRMMKNTNSIRLVLQNVDGTPVNVGDFDFEIVGDNTLFNYDNNLLQSDEVTYKPWSEGQAQTGVSIVGPDQVVPQPVEVAYAELSTSRLMTGNSPRMLVKRHEDGETVIECPLNEYLLLMRSERFGDMGNQEFLDRESRWTLYFFLQAGTWLRTQIVVNDWVVRINNGEF